MSRRYFRSDLSKDEVVARLVNPTSWFDRLTMRSQNILVVAFNEPPGLQRGPSTGRSTPSGEDYLMYPARVMSRVAASWAWARASSADIWPARAAEKS